MEIVLAILPVLIQVSAAQFSVQPKSSYVVRDGGSVTIECIPSEAALECAWKVQMPDRPSLAGFLLKTKNPIKDVELVSEDPGNPLDCTITISPVSSKFNGNYTCSPYQPNGQVDSRMAELVVARKPVSVEFADNQAGQREVTVAADEPVAITCEARDARPMAELFWLLGEQELFEGIETSEQVDPGSGLVTSRSVLTHTFRKEEDGAQLRCEARHPGFDDGDVRDTQLNVVVHYAPYRAKGNDLGTLYGFTADQEGVVTVNFTANPPPSLMVWSAGESVQVGAGELSEDGRLKSGSLQEVSPGQHQYALQLNLQPVRMEDQDLAFQLRLANVIGDAVLTFRLGTGAAPPPAPEAAVGGGAIAGIIIAVLLLLLIIGLVAFARSRGKWCFAAQPSEAGAEASDTESAHDEKTDRPEKKGFKLSNLYSSLVTKKKDADVEAADSKNETDNLTAPADVEGGEEHPKKKEGEIVYAELVLDKDGLKTEVRPSPDKTEYAVIVGTKTENAENKE